MSDQWYFRLLNEEFGPVPQSAICEMMADGRLAPDDAVRRDGTAAWVPARSLQPAESGPEGPEELHDLSDLDFQFVDSRRSAPVPRPESRPEEPACADGDDLDMFLSDGDLPLEDIEDLALEDIPPLDGGHDRSRPVDPPSSPLPQRTAPGTTPQRPIAAATSDPADSREPRPAAATTADRRGELLAACLSQTPSADPRPKRRARRGLMTSLAQVNPFLLGLLAVGVLFLGWRWLAAGSRDAAVDYATLAAHYQALLDLRQQGASPAQWNEFAQRVRVDLDPMVEELEGMSAAKEPAQQQILFAARDGLLKMLDESPQRPGMAEARDFIPAMREAHTLLGSADLPGPPEQIASMAPKGPVPKRPEQPATEPSSSSPSL